uniref:SFRICE_041618 n=1 Tax=Spodoptera frugiperda TaxID=7108 RepID=A0A2H1VP52_SPOFR
MSETGLSEEEAQQLAQETVAREIADRSAELQALLDLQEVGFTPRSALARTPPQGFSTPLGTLEYAEGRVTAAAAAAGATAGKRGLSSPEEVQEAVRRRIAAVRMGRKEVPPMGGIQLRAARSPSPPCSEQGAEEEAPTENWVGPADPVTSAPVEQLAGLATASTKGIMEAVRGKTSKLNKDEIAAIGAHTERLGAVVTHLLLRLATAEREPAVAREKGRENLNQEAPRHIPPAGGPVRSFANTLRLGRDNAPVPIMRPPGPAVVIFPAEDQKERLKTAEDTRRALRTAVQPAKLGIQIAGLRKVGNAGVVVQTTSAAAAERLRKAVPDTLRATEPAARQPLIALTGIDKGATLEDVIADIKEQNLREEEWTKEKIGGALRVVFKRDRHHGRTKWVCSCTPELRKALVTRGKLFIGWDVVEVTDHLDVTCCNRCQQYWHPAKYCRAKTQTCGSCGEEGHGSADCKAQTRVCATCKRFGRRGAETHRTASRDCPARAHAEQRQVTAINYG